MAFALAVRTIPIGTGYAVWTGPPACVETLQACASRTAGLKLIRGSSFHEL
jgi:multidrug transporter EmrE-like cation transporter